MLDNELFWIIINKGVFFFEWIIIYLLCNTLDKPKTLKLIRYSMVFIFALSGILLNDIGVHPNTKVLVLIVFSFLLYKVNYEVSLQKSTLVVLIFWMANIGLESVVMAIMMYVCGISDVSVFLINGIYRLVTMIITKGMLVVLLVIMRNNKVSINIRTKDILCISLPIFTNIIVLLMFFGTKLKPYKYLDKRNTDVLILAILVFISNIFIVLLIEKIVRENKLILENNFIKEKMSTQYEYYERMREKQFRTRQLYHDMKNHLSCMERLNNKDSKEYIDSIKKEINKLENNFNTGNMILDIVLDEKQGICQQKNINFISKIDSSKLDFVEDIDICSIFSNALDNAIEACNKIRTEEKHISIASTYIKNFCMIKIENSKINDIVLENGKIITNKKDKLLHGIGIDSIKRTVEKYDGQLVVDYSKKKFVLKIMIPLKVSKAG